MFALQKKKRILKGMLFSSLLLTVIISAFMVMKNINSNMKVDAAEPEYIVHLVRDFINPSNPLAAPRLYDHSIAYSIPDLDDAAVDFKISSSQIGSGNYVLAACASPNFRGPDSYLNSNEDNGKREPSATGIDLPAKLLTQSDVITTENKEGYNINGYNDANYNSIRFDALRLMSFLYSPGNGSVSYLEDSNIDIMLGFPNGFYNRYLNAPYNEDSETGKINYNHDVVSTGGTVRYDNIRKAFIHAVISALLHGNTFSVELLQEDKVMVANAANNIMAGIQRMNLGQSYNDNASFSSWIREKWALATQYRIYHLDTAKFGTGNWSMLSQGNYAETIAGSSPSKGTTGNQDVIWTESPVYGSITVRGCDADTGGCSTTGGATLNGTTFTITNKSGHPITHNNTIYNDNEVIISQTITGGACSLPKVEGLPYGTYEVKQTAQGDGYNPPSTLTRTVNIPTDTQVDFTVPMCNKVKRGNVKLAKTSDNGGTMADIVFTITSNTTNERHIVVTNSNGIIDTSLITHSSNTNGYDSMSASSITYQGYGTWFYGNNTSSGTIEDVLGALPYDSYTIQEQNCDGNKYCYNTTRSQTFSIAGDATTPIDLGTWENDCASFNVSTTAVDADSNNNSHYILPKASAKIRDTVNYTVREGLEYRIDGEVIDKTNNNVQIATSSTGLFTPNAATGSKVLEFTFDASNLAGHELVVYERLYRNNELIASHIAPDDTNQIVWVSNLALSTIATDEADGDKYIEANKEATIIDNVTFRGKPNTEYRFQGAIKIKGASQVLLTVNGAAMTDANGSGTTTMPLLLTAADLANKGGKELIVYEYMCEGTDMDCDNKIFSHASDDDLAQTIYITSLSTVATDDADDDKSVAEQANAVVRDTVKYCAVKNHAYTLKSDLVEKNNPSNIIASKETSVTTSQNGCGETSVLLEFSAVGLQGKDLVVYEYLMDNSSEIIKHANPNDANQTVKVMNLNTIAYDATIVDKYVEAKDVAEVKDQVNYCVEPNHEYRLVSKLMDKEMRAVAKDINGSEIVSETTINTPKGCDQELVVFTFNPKNLYGKELVAFEYIYDGNNLVLAHEDYDDPNQSTL